MCHVLCLYHLDILELVPGSSIMARPSCLILLTLGPVIPPPSLEEELLPLGTSLPIRRHPRSSFTFPFQCLFLSYNQETAPQVVISFSFPIFDRTLSPCGAPSNVVSLFLFDLSTLVFPPPLPSVVAYLFYLSPSGQYILDRWDTPRAQLLRQRPR